MVPPSLLCVTLTWFCEPSQNNQHRASGAAVEAACHYMSVLAIAVAADILRCHWLSGDGGHGRRQSEFGAMQYCTYSPFLVSTSSQLYRHRALRSYYGRPGNTVKDCDWMASRRLLFTLRDGLQGQTASVGRSAVDSGVVAWDA
jgi:hypothetical protein